MRSDQQVNNSEEAAVLAPGSGRTSAHTNTSWHLLHLHPVLCKLLEPARPANFLYESLFLGSLVEEDGCGMRKGLSGHIQFWGLKWANEHVKQ